MIYMDNAATTMQKPKEVGEAICQALFTIGTAGRGAADGALSASRIIFEYRFKRNASAGGSRDHDSAGA